jgi:sugar fermentation stimulation protein A
MRYSHVSKAVFIDRPNRFIANVKTVTGVERVHVKNTGRCKELLVPGATVYLEEGCGENRKTKYDLIAVEKAGNIVNMDAQAPNRLFGEWAESGRFLPDLTGIRREYSYGASRLDFCLETSSGLHLVEVKGVTLEESGIARFPDAPTERGVKHIRELQKAVESGLSATICFVVQMEGIRYVEPNDATHPEFGATLREAAACGVNVIACDCSVAADYVVIRDRIPVKL